MSPYWAESGCSSAPGPAAERQAPVVRKPSRANDDLALNKSCGAGLLQADCLKYLFCWHISCLRSGLSGVTK